MAETKFNTKRVRFSYPHLFQKDQNDKYSVQLLIPKTDDVTMGKLKAACKQVYLDHKTDVFKGLEFDEVNKPYHDGDGRKPKGGAYGPEAKGMWVVNASTNSKISIVDRERNKVIDEDTIYPGVYGRANITVATYNMNGNKGIKCYLNGVMTYAYGERIGNVFNADDFDDGYEDPDNEEEDDIL